MAKKTKPIEPEFKNVPMQRHTNINPPTKYNDGRVNETAGRRLDKIHKAQGRE